MATASDLTSGMSSIVRGLSSAVRNMGVAMTAASALAGAGMVALSQRAERVSEAFREVDTISSQVSDSQEEYGQLISELNTEFGINANRLEIIEGLYQSVSAGVQEGEEAQRQFLETAGRLSVVGRVDLATTVDVLSTSMNAYGKGTEFADRASNALFRTVQFGKTTMEELAPVMGRVTALGSEMDIAIEELGASMAVLTRTGFESRIAATGLRATIRALMRPSEAMTQVLRDIALEQDLFAESMDEGSDAVRGIAEDYREATDALSELEQKQKEARSEVEKNSLVIQEARLLQQAIEQDRREEAESVIQTEKLKGKSMEELEKIISDYRFEVNQARVEEEQSRLEKQKLQNQVKELEKEFKNQIASTGDLEGNIGQLVVENEGLVSTLTKIRDRAEEQGIAMGELFQRSRGLQAVLAMVGEDGQLLNEIFTAMQDEGELTEEQMQSLQEKFGITREKIEELKEGASTISEEYAKTKGPTQNLRDAQAQLSEAAAELGAVFNEDVTNSLTNFAESIDNLTEFLRGLDEEVRRSISRFSSLSVGIGLLLGPMLLFGGQIALIAQALGAMFIPFVLTAGTVVGLLASAFSTAVQGGDDAEAMFSTMENIISNLTGTLTFLKNVFVEEVLPGMETAGEGVISLFSAIFNEFSDSSDEGGSLIRKFASLWGDAFETIGTFLKNNSEDIADFMAFLVDGLVNKVIPAIEHFASVFIEDILPQIISLIRDDVVPVIKNDIIPALQNMWKTFSNDVLPWVKNFFSNELVPALKSITQGVIDVAQSLVELAKKWPIEEILRFLNEGAQELLVALTDLVEAVGRFLSENDKLIAQLLILVSVAGAIFGPLMKIAGIIGTVVGAFKVLIGAGSVLKATLLVVGKAVAILGGPITILVGLIALLASAFITDFMGIRSATVNLYNSAKDAFNGILRFIKTLLKRASPFINSFIGLVQEFISALVHNVNIFLSLAIPVIKMAIGVLNALFKAFLVVASPVIRFNKILLSFWKKTASVVFSALAKIVGITIPFVIKQIKFLIKFVIILMDIATALLKVWQGDFTAIGDIIAGFVKLAVVAFKSLIEFLLFQWDIAGVVFGAVKEMAGLVMGLIVALIVGVIEAFINLPGRIISGLESGFKSLIDTFISFFDNLLDTVYEQAKNIPSQIAKGIEDNMPDVMGAVDSMANKISNSLPFSPAKRGPLSGGRLKDGGRNIAGNTAKGIRENEDEVVDSVDNMMEGIETEEDFEAEFDMSVDEFDMSEDLDLGGMVGKSIEEKYGGGFDEGMELIRSDDNFDVESGMNTSLGGKGKKGGFGTGKNTKKIIIKDKAIYFEEGAFQGISDGEMPKKVRDEVDRSLDGILNDLTSKGVEVE